MAVPQDRHHAGGEARPRSHRLVRLCHLPLLLLLQKLLPELLAAFNRSANLGLCRLVVREEPRHHVVESPAKDGSCNQVVEWERQDIQRDPDHDEECHRRDEVDLVVHAPPDPRPCLSRRVLSKRHFARHLVPVVPRNAARGVHAGREGAARLARPGSAGRAPYDPCCKGSGDVHSEFASVAWLDWTEVLASGPARGLPAGLLEAALPAGLPAVMDGGRGTASGEALEAGGLHPVAEAQSRAAAVLRAEAALLTEHDRSARYAACARAACLVDAAGGLETTLEECVAVAGGARGRLAGRDPLAALLRLPLLAANAAEGHPPSSLKSDSFWPALGSAAAALCCKLKSAGLPNASLEQLWREVGRQPGALAGMVCRWARLVTAGRSPHAAALPCPLLRKLVRQVLSSEGGASMAWGPARDALVMLLGDPSRLPRASLDAMVAEMVLPAASGRRSEPRWLAGARSILAYLGHFPAGARDAASAAPADRCKQYMPPLAALVDRWEAACSADDEARGSVQASVRHVSDDQHRALTAAILLCLGSSWARSAAGVTAGSALSGRMFGAISSRLASVDPIARASGMRVAEALSLCVSPSRPLVFPDAAAGSGAGAADPGMAAWTSASLCPVSLRPSGASGGAVGRDFVLAVAASQPPVGAAKGAVRPSKAPGAPLARHRAADMPEPAGPSEASLDPDEPVGALAVSLEFLGATSRRRATSEFWTGFPLQAPGRPWPASFVSPPAGRSGGSRAGGPRAVLRQYGILPSEACTAVEDPSALVSRQQLGRMPAASPPRASPAYLRDAVALVRSQAASAPAVMSALRALPRLVSELAGAQGSQHELLEVAASAVSALLHASDRFNLGAFMALRADALLALLQAVPSATVPVVAGTVFAPEQPLGIRLDAAALLADAASDLAGLRHKRQPRPRPTSRRHRVRRIRYGDRLSQRSTAAFVPPPPTPDRFSHVALAFIGPLLAGLEATLRPAHARGRAGVTDPWGDEPLLLAGLLRATATVLECCRRRGDVSELSWRTWQACSPALSHDDAGVRAAAAAVAAAIVSREAEAGSSATRQELASRALMRGSPADIAAPPPGRGITGVPPAVLELIPGAHPTSLAGHDRRAAMRVASWAHSAATSDSSDVVRQRASMCVAVLTSLMDREQAALTESVTLA